MKITVDKFIEAFFNPEDDVCIRVFSDKKDGSFRGQKYKGPAENINKLIPELINHNNKNRGIFFVVNHGGDKDVDIQRINAQFFESDTLTFQQQLEGIKKFPLEPSIIVKTRKSLHVYFLIEDGKVEDFRRIQQKLANDFNGDKSCVNESRVLRLPGFNHCKEEPMMVQCIKFNPELKYTQQEIEKHLKPLEGQRLQTQPNLLKSYKPTQKGLDIVCTKCSFIKHCKENANKLPEHDWYAMISNLSVFKGGIHKIHEYSSGYAAYSEKETNEKIEHYIKSKTGPIKCSTIGEKGFKCPEMGVTCTETSPASLCFTPLDNNTILQLISSLPVSDEIIENTTIAIDFIENYMFSMEPAMADIFIDSALKEHLKIKNTKALKSHYKKVNKEHCKDEEKGRLSLEIPKWYRPQKNDLKFMPGILAEHLKETVNAFYAAESFYIYKDGVYNEMTEDEVSNKVRDYMLKDYCTMSSIKDAKDQWRITKLKPLKDINPNPYILNLKNGLYDINEKAIKIHTPKYLSNVQLNVNYNDEAQCPRFLEFLEGVLDSSLIPLIQEMIGYLLVPITQAQKSFVFVGPPRTGKSTLLWVIENLLLGESNVSNIPWQELGDRFKTAELIGKLANIFSDLPNKAIEDAGVFKVLTGEDYLMGEKKNKNPFKFKPFARLVFSCNEIPRNYGDKTMAFYRRLVIIPFSKQVEEKNIDPKLKEKLEAEVEGIFLWAIKGLERLIENDFRFSENQITEDAKTQYRYENNNVLTFVDECCTLSNDVSSSSKDVYDKYKEYCYESGYKPLSQIKFNSELENNFTDLKRGRDSMSRRRIWSGISVSMYI